MIDVYIRYLRKKIDENYEPKLIHTVRGHGYVLKAPVWNARSVYGSDQINHFQSQ